MMQDHYIASDLMSCSRNGVVINRQAFRLPEAHYMANDTKKSLIVLHGSGGVSAAQSYSAWLADPHRVACSYIVDLDGVIYETFDPWYWAYALGVQGQPDGHTERRAIQIEIVNPGPLRQEGEWLYWWPHEFATRYCRVDETDKYVESSYRDYEFFSAYPDVQRFAVYFLVLQLCRKYGVPSTLPPEALRAEADLAFFDTYAGIASHQNFRSDKVAMGPAWNWSEMESYLQEADLGIE